MRKNQVFYFSLFILLFKQFHNYIVYPLKTLEENNNSIEALLSFNSTYTILEIGNPPQRLIFILIYFTPKLILPMKDAII